MMSTLSVSAVAQVDLDKTEAMVNHMTATLAPTEILAVSCYALGYLLANAPKEVWPDFQAQITELVESAALHTLNPDEGDLH